MNKIKEMTIKNFKGINPDITINLCNSCKNLVIYGENGVGKTSVIQALFTFLAASNRNVKQDLENYKNIYSIETASIRIKFKDDSDYTIDKDNTSISNTIIEAISKSKAFLSYKDLLKTYHTDNTNIYDLLLKDILKDIPVPPENKKTFGFYAEIIDRFNEIEQLKKIYANFRTPKENETVQMYHAKNSLYKELHNEYKKATNNIKNLKVILHKIEPDIESFLKEFGYDFKIFFLLENLHNQKIYLKAKIDSFDVESPNLFFNEAKLTAIALSIYFSILKNYNPADPKFLFLDDILIGMDLGHRLPILKILKDHFDDYQIFIFTYDQFWFDIMKQRLGNTDWCFYKIDDIENQTIIEHKDFLQKSEYYYSNGDYKASAAYLRTEFERLLKKYASHKGLKIRYKERPEKLTTDDFWQEIKNEASISHLIRDIEIVRTNVLNNFVHLSSKPIYKSELREAIDKITQLKALYQILLKN